MKIAIEVAKESCEVRWEEAIGPAYEACMEYQYGAYRPGLRLAAKTGMKKHFTTEITKYGHVSVDYLASEGIHIEDRIEETMFD